MTGRSFADLPDADLEEAVAAATAQAYPGDDANTLVVHSFSLSVPGVMLGAEWSLESVLAELRQATDLKWDDSNWPVPGHDLLIVTADERLMAFGVSRAQR